MNWSIGLRIQDLFFASGTTERTGATYAQCLCSGSIGGGTFGPGSAVVNPTANEPDLLVGQRIPSHRHPLAFNLSADHLHEQALGAVSWKNHFAGESPRQGF